MKKLLKTLLVFTLGLAAAGCAKEYDDSELKGKVNELDRKVSELTQKVNDLNAQVVAMKEVMDAWQQGSYIDNIDESIPGQHTITFTGGKKVILYDGIQGQAPEITIQKEGEEYFWYVGTTKLGPAAYTLGFSFNDKGELIVTIDGKQTNLGSIKGDSWFKDVTVTPNEKVTFTLADDTSFEIPFAKTFKLIIENPDRFVKAGDVVEFPYTVQNANATTTVDAFAGGLYTVSVLPDKISVTAPDPAAPGQVLVWAQNGEGLFSMVKLNFSLGAEMTVLTSAEALAAVPREAGSFEIDLVSNVEPKIEQPAESWVSAVLTKANYKITLTLEENTTGEPREASIKVLRADNDDLIETIQIVQIATAADKSLFTRVWGKYSTESEAWNKYFCITEGQDRSIALGDDCIYLPETTAEAVLWKIPIDGISAPTQVPVGGVSGGTFAIGCVRLVPNLVNTICAGKDYALVLTNMTQGSDPINLYFYRDGDAQNPEVWTSAAPNRRLGDSFTWIGSINTGRALWKDYANTNEQGAVVYLNSKWTSNQGGGWVSGRITMAKESGRASVYAYPDYDYYTDRNSFDPSSVVDNYLYVSTASAHFFSGVKWGAANDAPTTDVDLTELYANTGGFQFFEQGGQKYIAYAKYESSTKGRLVVIKDKGTGAQFLETLQANEVVFEAPIQHESDFTYASPKASGNSGIDCSVRVIDGVPYIAVLQQHVGLSLFKMNVN